MKTVFLLRHAKSSWEEPELRDFDRPLSPRGRSAAKKIGQYMKVKGILPGLVISSPSARTRETIERLEGGLGEKLDVKFLDSLYLGAARTLAEDAMETPEEVSSLMIIGHNPGMHALAVHWAAKGPEQMLESLYAKFPTGALAEIEFRVNNWPAVASAHGELKRFVLPRSL